MTSRPSRKRPVPLDEVHRYLEPGPVVLVSSAHDGERDVMVMGWHTVMEFSPSLVGCVISSANHSFGLTPEPCEQVGAPAISECHAHFECRLYDDTLVDNYNFFIWEVVAARAAVTPRHPETLHYKGDGVFMVAGTIIRRRRPGLK